MKSSSGRRFRLLAIPLVAGLAACVRPAPPPPAPPPVVRAPAGVPYRIDAAHSDARILVYRAGALARFGHNHVLRVHGLEGRLWLPEPPAAARFELRVAVAALEVDPEAARAEEGEEFATHPTRADVDGTRRNLLSPAVLDAATYPSVTVEGEGPPGSGTILVHARIGVRGGATPVEVPVAVTRTAEGLSLRGGFSVRQTDLGMTPFSVALGALQVRDEVAVRFSLLARPEPPGG